MSSIVGFTAFHSLTPKNVTAALAAQRRALSYFPHLEHKSLAVGETSLELWGHREISDRLYSLPDSSLLVLVGSPHGEVSWSEVAERLAQAAEPDEFELPWDGRVNLLRISADGKQWTMWNDWIGSIPVFHTQINHGRIAGTLEPAIAAAAGFTFGDIFLPGLVSLLINGNFIGDWTLFKGMKVVPPDCLGSWNGRSFDWKRSLTVKPTDARWEVSWDELVDEMHELSSQAIADVLKAQSKWVLPLSGGLDSRLIAAVSAGLGVDIFTRTWGSRASTDVIAASRVARALRLPWKWIGPRTDYLSKYARQWSDLFGSSMHFHGMYQMPFLDTLRFEPSAPIVSGFLGEALSGYDVRFQNLLHSPSKRVYQTHPDCYIHWSAQEVQSLMKIEVADALEELASEIERQRNATDGPWFQRLRFLGLWGRQCRFTNFQSSLSNYWREVATPYLNREYARFCLSLPRTALENRSLQADVFRRYHGTLATIPGSYASDPYILTGRYLLKRRIGSSLPSHLRFGPFQEFNPTPLSQDPVCVRDSGPASLWPVFAVSDRLAAWLDFSQIETVYASAFAGDLRSVRKLQSVQTLAYRLLDSSTDDSRLSMI